MSTAELLDRRAAPPVRPKHYSELLLEPIVDTPADGVSDGEDVVPTNYEGWEVDHAVARRFYVLGVRWLCGTTGLDQAALIQARESADERVRTLTSWPTMHDPDGIWDKALGRPQIRHAWLAEPMPFAKAAQVLMACEIAMDRLMDDPKKRSRLQRDFVSPEYIYSKMAIIPACCNIDDFSEDYLRRVQDIYGNQITAIRDNTGLRSAQAVSDLAAGYTVTRKTALSVRKYAISKYAGPQLTLGPVRAKPGRFLGTGNATVHEQVNVL